MDTVIRRGVGPDFVTQAGTMERTSTNQLMKRVRYLTRAITQMREQVSESILFFRMNEAKHLRAAPLSALIHLLKPTGDGIHKRT